VTTYAYDGTSSRLTSITDANAHTAVTMTYDSCGRVATQKDARGLTTGEETTFAYGPTDAQCHRTPDAQGNVTTTLTYPPSSFDGKAMTVVDTYNSQGQIAQRVTTPSNISGESYTESYTYEPSGFRNATTDARGNTTFFCHDVDYAGSGIAGSLGNVTRVIAPAAGPGGSPLVTLIKYDAKNNVIESAAPKAVSNGSSVSCSTNLSGAVNTSGLSITDMAYDATLGTELLSVTRKYTDPDTQAIQSAITKFEYGDAANPGLVTRVIPPRGNTGVSPDYSYATTLTYYGPGSQAGLLHTVSDALSNTTTYAYDGAGRRTSLVDPLGNTWSFQYDNEDRLTQASAPAPSTGGSNLTTSAQFDPVGNRQSLTDASGQITRYLYDERDSLKEVDQSATVSDPNADSSKVVTAYQYDDLGNLLRVDRAAGNATYESVVDYAYDGLNRVRKETQYPQGGWPTSPNGSTGSPTLITQTAYDANSNRSTLIDPLGQTTSFGYDSVNRLTGITYSDGQTPGVGYAYDGNGNRSSMTDGTGSTTYTYDELDRLLSVSSPGPQTVGYRYDVDGNRTKLIYPDGTAVNYTFDAESRLQSLQDWANHTTSYSYFADGLLQTATNPNNTTAQFI
jgi:YD repeat-containing protein